MLTSMLLSLKNDTIKLCIFGTTFDCFYKCMNFQINRLVIIIGIVIYLKLWIRDKQHIIYNLFSIINIKVFYIKKSLN